MITATGSAFGFRTAFANGKSYGFADMPLEKGGDGNGFGPHELLEAALASCMTMTVRLLADKLDYPLESIRFVVRIDRSNPEGIRLEHSMTLDGRLSDEQKRQLIESASRCPVAKTLTGGLTIRAADISNPDEGS